MKLALKSVDLFDNIIISWEQLIIFAVPVA